MMTDLREHFSTLEDPRIDRNKRHELLDIVFAFICVYLRLFAFICVYLRLFAAESSLRILRVQCCQ